MAPERGGLAGSQLRRGHCQCAGPLSLLQVFLQSGTANWSTSGLALIVLLIQTKGKQTLLGH